jgi:hypothetical protein
MWVPVGVGLRRALACPDERQQLRAKEATNMPVKVAKRNGKYRVVEASGRVAKGSKGKARDGGGHASKAKAARQARVINSSPSK